MTWHQNFRLAFLITIVFFFSLLVHYFVYYHWGFVHTQYYNLIIARNWAQTGQLSFESQSNVILSTGDLKEQGVPTDSGNKLIYFIYGLLFKIFGFSPLLPLHVSFILYSLAAVCIFLTGWRLFGEGTGLIAAFLSMVAPFALPPANMVGHHEWAFLFLALAILFYFWERNPRIQNLVLTGLFLGVSMGAKNSFFVAFFAFFVFGFLYRKKNNGLKEAFLKLSVFLISFLLFALPFTLIGGNNYFSEMLGWGKVKYDSITVYGHLFPDSYTFHYAKDEFLRNFVAGKKIFSSDGFALWGDSGPFLKEFGWKISFFRSEIITRIYSAWIYFKGFLSSIVFGGFLSWFFIGLGLSSLLKRKEKAFAVFCAIFFASWLGWLVLLRTSNYMQNLILVIPFSILMGIGILKLGGLIAPLISFWRLSAKKVSLAVAMIFIMMFFQLSWWSLREYYFNSKTEEQLVKFASTQKDSFDFSKKGVIAVGLFQRAPDILNYYFDRSFVYFAPETIKMIANKKELESVFRQYNISGYIGFDEVTVKIIQANTNSLKEYQMN